jgi:hypothetical protein
MQLFTSQILGLFTIRQVARTLEMHPSMTHKAIHPLIKNKILTLNKQKYLGLDYTKNHDTLAYAEYLRRNEFLSKARNGTLALLVKDVIDSIKEDCFIFMLFGSAVISSKPRDIDILLIVDKIDKVEQYERFLDNMCGLFTLKFHPVVISFESVYEMFGKRNQLNVMNETLNKHIIFYGAETFYRLLAKGREP